MQTMQRSALAAAAIAGPALWWARHLRSPEVRSWEPSQLGGDKRGSLHVRHKAPRFGNGDRVFVLLHGLVATGDVFGAAFDLLADEAYLVVPDLLGFGRSLEAAPNGFMPHDHLDTLDESLLALGLDDHRVVVGAHSIGSALALRWAERRASQIERVVCWGAPMYPSRQALGQHLAGEGFMTKLFVANTEWARRACVLNYQFGLPGEPRSTRGRPTATRWNTSSPGPIGSGAFPLPATLARRSGSHGGRRSRSATCSTFEPSRRRSISCPVPATISRSRTLRRAWGS